jgi:hypothetical protein
VIVLLTNGIAMLLQAYDPQLQLHMLLYDDGDLEQLNLCEEQWELLQQQPAPTHAAAAAAAGEAACEHAAAAWIDDAGKRPQQQLGVQLSERSPAASDSPASNSDDHHTHALAVGTADIEHTRMAAAAAAAPAAPLDAMDVDSEALTNPSADQGGGDDADADDDSAWLAAAEAAAAERPLRVMWDSHACVMRVIAAADLVAAEHEMRRQQRQHQQHQQHQQHLQSELWYDAGNPGGCRLAAHAQHHTSAAQPPLLPAHEGAWAAEQQQQQQVALALFGATDGGKSLAHNLQAHPHWQQQQQQQLEVTAGQQWHCSAGEERAPLLPQLLAGPAALSTSSSEATADRQPDEQVRHWQERCCTSS